MTEIHPHRYAVVHGCEARHVTLDELVPGMVVVFHEADGAEVVDEFGRPIGAVEVLSVPRHDGHEDMVEVRPV